MTATPITIIQFAYKTEDQSKDCEYWLEYVAIENQDFNFVTIQNAAQSYMEYAYREGDYRDATEAIMNTTGYYWKRLVCNEPVFIERILTIWL